MDEVAVTMTSDPAPTPAPARAKRGAVAVADVPHMATRYNPANELPPSKVAAKSEKLYRWLCSLCGAEWEAMINSWVRHPELAGCPACAAKQSGAQRARPAPGASLADKHPGTAAQ